MPEPVINREEWDVAWRRGYATGPPIFGQKAVAAAQLLENHYALMAQNALKDAAILQGYVAALHDRTTSC